MIHRGLALGLLGSRRYGFGVQRRFKGLGWEMGRGARRTIDEIWPASVTRGGGRGGLASTVATAMEVTAGVMVDGCRRLRLKRGQRARAESQSAFFAWRGAERPCSGRERMAALEHRAPAMVRQGTAMATAAVGEGSNESLAHQARL
jgi:hypothetical protein